MLFEGYRVDCTLKKTQRKTERGRLALQHSSLSTSGGKYLLNIIHLWPPLRLLMLHPAAVLHSQNMDINCSEKSHAGPECGNHCQDTRGPAEFKDSDCPCLLLTILSGWHTIRHSGTSWAQPSCHLVDALISSALEEPTVLKYIICID